MRVSFPAPQPTLQGFESHLGPIQLTVQVDDPRLVMSVEAHVDGKVYPGVMDSGAAVFLLPPWGPEGKAVKVVQRTRQGKAIEQTVFVQGLEPDDGSPERPYELRGPRREGLVLKRSQIYGSGPPNEQPSGEVLALLMKYGGAPVLDVGCGIGAYVAALNAKRWRAAGLEVHPDYVREATRRGLDVKHYDGATIPYADGSFDTVAGVEVLEHVDDWEALLREMIRVSSRRVLITTPNIGVLCGMGKYGVVPWHILEATHVNFFTLEAWRHWILKAEEVRGFAVPFGDLSINGEIFKIHIFVLIEKNSH